MIKAAGYQLSLVDSAENKALEMNHIESLYLRDVGGIIISPTATECAYLGSVLPPGFPLVVVDRQAVNFVADCVLLNNEKASFDTVSHLVKAGRRRIGFVSFHYGEQEIDPTIMERVRGYKRVLSRAGLEVHIAYPKISVVEQPAERLLARIQKPPHTFEIIHIDAQLILSESC